MYVKIMNMSEVFVPVKDLETYPDNDVKSFEDIKKLKDSDNIELDRYDELIPLIKGYACPFQRDFLCH